MYWINSIWGHSSPEFFDTEESAKKEINKRFNAYKKQLKDNEYYSKIYYNSIKIKWTENKALMADGESNLSGYSFGKVPVEKSAIVRAADEMAAKTQWLLNKAETLSGWEWDDLKHSDDVSNALFHYRKMRDRQ